MRGGVSWIVLAIVLAIVGCGGAASERDAGALLDAPAPPDAVPDAALAEGWRLEADVPEPIQEIAGAVHEGRLWIAGGLDRTAATRDVVRVLDPATGMWSEGPPLPAPRHHAMMVSTGDALYVLGGMETLRFEPLDTAWRLAGDAWEPIAPLPEDRGAAAAGFVGGRIVIAGGNASRGGLATTTLLYDPTADAWSIGAGLPTPREHTSAVVHGGELWVIAGRMNSIDTNLADVHAYDVATDTWRAGPPIPTARGGHGAAILDGVAYVVGGEEPGGALALVEALDLATGTWSTAAPAPRPHHGHAVLAAGGRLWIVAGGDRPSLAATPFVESFTP